MSADVNQDFITYSGDSVAPIFTVRNAANEIIDISTVAEIVWNARRNLETAVVLNKLKTTGGIVFVTDGTDGEFQVLIDPTDTLNLTGAYIHEAILTDSGGNVTTVSIGVMQVGLAPTWTYDPSLLSTVPLYQVRRLIGDVKSGDQQLADAEILFALSQYTSSVYAAAAECARNIAIQAAREVDVAQGEVRTAYSQKAKTYNLLAAQLEQRGFARGGFTVFAGGISQQQKTAEVLRTDRVPPQFNIGLSDNMNMPISPINTQVPAGAPGTNEVVGGGGV